MTRQSGLTLLELLVVVAVIGILTGIAVPSYSKYRMEAYDISAKADLRNAMPAIEAALSGSGTLPASAAVLEQYGHHLSPGVSFTRYQIRVTNGINSVHMHTKHAQSTRSWHADYPATGAAIEVR